MRTTLDIDADVLQAARERARRERCTLGQMLSQLGRLGLTRPANGPVAPEPQAVHGLRPFPSRGTPVTNERVEQLREDDSY